MSGGAIVATSLDVIYWRGSAELRSDLIHGLGRDGYNIHTVRDFEEVLDLSAKLNPAFIIVDGTAGEGEASKRVVELSSAAKLYEVRVIFISVQASKRAAVLQRQFKHFATVDVPFSVESVIADINKKVRGDAAKSEVQTGSSSKSTAPRSISAKLKSAPGRQFATANKLLFFDDSRLLPKHPKREVIKKLLDELTEKDRWLGLHARRVAYLSSTISNVLKLSQQREENVCVVSLLLSGSMFGAAADVKRCELFEAVSDERRDELLSRIRQSGKIATQDLEDALAEKTISAIAAMLENVSMAENLTADESAVYQDAQCALAAEFADRACWNLDFWNPRGAHKALRKLREGKTLIRDPQIVDALARVLTQALLLDWRLTNAFDIGLSDEAISSRSKAVSQAIRDAKKLFSGVELEEMPLYDLEIGMVLGSPVVSNDGKVIAPANLRLDDDIIWRIWTLAGIRPLKPTVYVAEEFAPLAVNS